jgi:hypothetical protein
MADVKEPNVTVRRGAPVLTPRRTTPAAPVVRETPTPARSNETDTVQVWPHLVVIEFLGAVVITINIILLGTLINGPLEEIANPDRTPNPAKAPWYFLNLQELLLHMNSALAGVIVPTVALLLIAAIPYFDKGTKGLGVWFYSKRGPRIMALTTVYTLVCEALLIALDKFIPLKDTFQSLIGPNGALGGLIPAIAGSESEAQANWRGILTEAIVGWILPTLIMIILTVILLVILRATWRDIDRSEIVIALFTGFVVTYVVLTFVGTAMRGPGMDLYPPWAVPPVQRGGFDMLLQLLRLG